MQRFEGKRDIHLEAAGDHVRVVSCQGGRGTMINVPGGVMRCNVPSTAAVRGKVRPHSVLWDFGQRPKSKLILSTSRRGEAKLRDDFTVVVHLLVLTSK